MAHDETVRYAAGIGARRGVAAEAIVDLVREVAGRHDAPLERLSLCTLESKAEEPGVQEAARMLGVPLVFLPLEALKARKGAAPTHSPRVQAMFGVGSVAEAAALVGAGPKSRLLAPRLATPYAACALAVGAEEVE
ncbi:cobalamin biosynthesis protein [Methylocystis parvus]|uniref:Cobalamin biosynthesis protein n=1 Tax=Methylocystis parvus TaxID=134 RepID=A0A6B8M1G8_9HYPH|nr:cobalamin biosynthesis protein [Methylocystis parvus]QGM96132.1 cobalamin biosynthesis protein [Methylocystis parvus]WBK00046.1 cobalamin biosynthesis protein [Methylocystis parvus OBBP]